MFLYLSIFIRIFLLNNCIYVYNIASLNLNISYTSNKMLLHIIYRDIYSRYLKFNDYECNPLVNSIICSNNNLWF